MNFKEIQELIRLVSKSDLAEFKVKDGEFELSIKTQKALKMPEMQAISYQPSYTMQPTQHQAAPAPKALEAAPTPAAAPESGQKQIEIKSPMVGTFYRSGGPDKPPFVKVGDKIESGKTVCIIEAMKLFNEIESEVKGTIVKVCVEDASPVEYDQVLFIVEP